LLFISGDIGRSGMCDYIYRWGSGYNEEKKKKNIPIKLPLAIEGVLPVVTGTIGKASVVPSSISHNDFIIYTHTWIMCERVK
jgi:hypothetical protein